MTLSDTNIKSRGFTIVELLIVIVIIAILAAITIVAYNGIQNRAKTSAGQQLANSVAKKAEAYAAARTTGSGYPTHAELTAVSSAVAEAQLDTPAAVVAYSTATGNAGVTTVAANYNNGKTVIYRLLTGGGCVFYWDFANSTPQRAVTTVGTATMATCTA